MMKESHHTESEMLLQTENKNVSTSSINPNTEEVEDVIEKKIEVIDEQLEMLDDTINEKSSKISEDAIKRSEDLREDLIRLKKNFKENLHQVRHMAQNKFKEEGLDMNRRIEHAEDELSQINEELKEWFEINT